MEELTEHGEGRRSRALSKLVSGSDRVFPTVCSRGFTDFQSVHVPGAAQSYV